MKPTIRRAADRFHSDLGWLDSRHTFSFGEHQHPDHMGYRSLRVINDDTVAPGGGFGTHGHSQMEIFSYVISGELAHKDSMGNGRTITAGEFQYMSAGTGIKHSEFNPSATEPVHFLQIWLQPNESGEPRYRDFDTKPLREKNGLTTLASGSGENAIRQDAQIQFGHLSSGTSLTIPATEDRPYRWLHLISGEIALGEETLSPGDGASFESEMEITATTDAEFIIFHLS